MKRREEARVVFLHGLESSAVSDKAKWLEQNYDAYCPVMDYRNPHQFQDIYNEIWRINPRMIIGSSMGGYFAYCLGTLLGIRTMLLNPAVHSRSFDPQGVHVGSTPVHHTIILGKNDNVINPKVTKEWFKRNCVGDYEIFMENNDHRTPLSIMQKYIEEAINEDWGTESPGVGAAVSILPEGLAGDLSSNFLSSRPFQGGFLAVENLKECGDVSEKQKGLSEEDIVFVKRAANSTVDVFYEYLTKRGYFIRYSEIEDIWNDKEANSIFDSLKETFKRPRPYWISTDVNLVQGTGLFSYSFPSAHAGLSWKIAIELGKKYPHLKDSLESIARKISFSRVHAGVHYPSDIQAGEMIAKRLWNN
jgi:hypothetical protein